MSSGSPDSIARTKAADVSESERTVSVRPIRNKRVIAASYLRRETTHLLQEHTKPAGWGAFTSNQIDHFDLDKRQVAMPIARTNRDSFAFVSLCPCQNRKIAPLEGPRQRY